MLLFSPLLILQRWAEHPETAASVFCEDLRLRRHERMVCYGTRGSRARLPNPIDQKAVGIVKEDRGLDVLG